MSFLTSTPLSHSSLVRSCLAAGVEFTDVTPPISMGDLIVANAVYQHAGTDDFVNPLPERDFSAIVIRYFSKHPERLSLEAMRAAMTTFVWDASNRRQHPRLDKLKEVYALATEKVQNEWLQLFVDQCVWIRRQAAREFR